MVYVIDINGHPLMPTERYGKVRRLLRVGKAKVIKRCPFTIQLLYATTTFIQDISLGVDAGSKHIGLSATTDRRELFASDVLLRDDIKALLSTRLEYRKARRHRTTRYRPARFNNRKFVKGRLSPSLLAKIHTHLKVISDIYKILPVSKIIVEVASFDLQKIKNPSICGVDYQHGDQYNFWNVREYVLCRDNHICQCCRGKSKDKILNVHHIKSRKVCGDAPDNLVTLCETCHRAYHSGEIDLPKTIKRKFSFSDATFMGVMRWAFYDELKRLYPNVHLTYGYITKSVRIVNNLPKNHYIDARCISGNPSVKPLGIVYYQKKVRCHNRQIHKHQIIKGGVRKRNQVGYILYGFRLFDKVMYNNHIYFIFGRRQSGFFDIRNLLGETVNNGSISYRKLKFISSATKCLIERRVVSL